ncbi:MAG TPA: glycosyltransferase family 39 protein [Chthoniobacterales bacterium]|nr:glycosyltransferase family 39 protein [Chthoniobacterales bacterium]
METPHWKWKNAKRAAIVARLTMDPTAPQDRQSRELLIVIGVWIVLAAITVLLARQNLSAPGLYYDEAVFAGLAKDFVTGHVHGQHMPDHETIMIAGRPFPLFVQTYLGALKSWMLIPVFQLFGSTFAALRASNIFWELIALLFLMLGAYRWLGFGAALITGALLALDPTYFFISTLDWGVAVPSFVCRCACFYFAIRWNQMHKMRDALLVGLFAGLGFFNKADFVVFLTAIAVATLVCYRREIFAAIRQHSGGTALACLGFAIGAGPMLLKIPRMFALTVSGPHPNAPGEFGVKLKTLLSMYDGSHFYRLMNVGGVFERMYDGAVAPREFFGVFLVLACFVFAIVVAKKQIARARDITFLIVAAALITLGIFAFPDAIRIHHSTLVYPLPQLVLAALIVAFWKIRAASKLDYVIPALIALVIVDLVASDLHAIVKTEQLIAQTGGRGRWSESLNAFCREARDRSDLTVVSLDWGFNEQLMFLTDGPQLSEPFWEFNQTLPPLPTDPNYVYLAHPPEYSVLKYDIAYLNQLQRGGANVEITPHLDRQGEIVFYTIRYRSQ